MQKQENIGLQLSTTPHRASRFSQNKFTTLPLSPAEATAPINARRVYAAVVHVDGVCCTDKEQRASFTGVLNWAIKLNAAIQSPVTEFTSFSSREFATRRYCITASAFAIYGLIVIAK